MRRRTLLLAALLVVTLLGGGVATPARPVVAADDYEVWIIDQSDSNPEGGGTLYIYPGAALAAQGGAAAPEVIDLGAAANAACAAETGTAGRRPHMLLFNAAQTHAIISWVATGHVLFLDAATRRPVACIDVGVQAHAAFPAPDQSYVVVANQNGKLLQRIRTNYTTNTFTLEDRATINLATCTTPSGAPCEDPALRADNAPICPVIDSSSRYTFVTLRGGGLLVVDSTTTPMAIVAEYTRSVIRPNGCGGVEFGGKMYINSGGGTAAAPLEAELYAFDLSAYSSTPAPVNTPARALVFSHNDRGFVDSHGAVLTRQGDYLWVADRAANRLVVVDTATDTVVNEIDLAGAVSADPAPDLMDISPTGDLVFLTLRGPQPLTANVGSVNNAAGSTPGLGIVRVGGGGSTGTFAAVAPISRIVNGLETADPHGLRVRRTFTGVAGVASGAIADAFGALGR
jgi:DNA-binding beta-propeller fold protein YncE